jgi:hypothetical protein
MSIEPDDIAGVEWTQPIVVESSMGRRAEVVHSTMANITDEELIRELMRRHPTELVLLRDLLKRV